MSSRETDAMEYSDSALRDSLSLLRQEDGAHVIIAARYLRDGEVISARSDCNSRNDVQRAFRDSNGLFETLYALPRSGERSTFPEWEEFWHWARAVCPEGSGHPLKNTTWCLPPPELSLIRHTDSSPNAALSVRVSTPPADTDTDTPAPSALCELRLLRDVPAGEEVTVDLGLDGRRTVSHTARLLSLLHPCAWASGRLAAEAAVAAALCAPALPGMPGWENSRTGSTCGTTTMGSGGGSEPGSGVLAVQKRVTGFEGMSAEAPSRPARVYTDYPLLAERLTSPSFELAEEPSGIDVLWLIQPIRDFRGLPQGLYLNQFPYEGCLVQKDLLPQLCRRCAAAGLDCAPAAYDLATEAHHFIRHFDALAERGADNSWIVKLAKGTRSSDACVTASKQTVLRYVDAPGGDRVVQKYIHRPLLVGERKFDMRVYVAVRSFSPLCAAVHSRYYGRVASRPFPTDDLNCTDFGAHFTVSWYNEEAPVPSELLNREALETRLFAEGTEWSPLDTAMREMLKGVFSSAGDLIGAWPYSRAVYGCDIMFERAEEGGLLRPRLLEVNFCGDWHTVMDMVPGDEDRNISFVDDTLSALVFSDEPWPCVWEALA